MGGGYPSKNAFRTIPVDDFLARINALPNREFYDSERSYRTDLSRARDRLEQYVKANIDAGMMGDDSAVIGDKGAGRQGAHLRLDPYEDYLETTPKKTTRPRGK